MSFTGSQLGTSPPSYQNTPGSAQPYQHYPLFPVNPAAPTVPPARAPAPASNSALPEVHHHNSNGTSREGGEEGELVLQALGGQVSDRSWVVALRFRVTRRGEHSEVMFRVNGRSER